MSMNAQPTLKLYRAFRGESEEELSEAPLQHPSPHSSNDSQKKKFKPNHRFKRQEKVVYPRRVPA
jgi:hypothetical protein